MNFDPKMKTLEFLIGKNTNLLDFCIEKRNLRFTEFPVDIRFLASYRLYAYWVLLNFIFY